MTRSARAQSVGLAAHFDGLEAGKPRKQGKGTCAVCVRTGVVAAVLAAAAVCVCAYVRASRRGGGGGGRVIQTDACNPPSC